MNAGANQVVRVFFLTTALLVFVSCATTKSRVAFHEETIAEDQTDAIVYVYRMSSFVGGGVSMPVKVDGQKVANLKQKAYVVFHITPGEHSISVGQSSQIAWSVNQAVTKKSRTFIAEPKGVYFLRSQAGVTFSITREEALREIVNMRYDMGM